MKRNLMLFLVSALLVCSLTACGCASKDAGSTQNSNGTAETVQPEAKPAVPEDTAPADRPETGTDDTVIDNGTAVRPGDSVLEDAGDAIENGVNNAADAITGTDGANTNNGVSIDDMLRTGRVRDN